MAVPAILFHGNTSRTLSSLRPNKGLFGEYIYAADNEDKAILKAVEMKLQKKYKIRKMEFIGRRLSIELHEDSPQINEDVFMKIIVYVYVIDEHRKTKWEQVPDHPDCWRTKNDVPALIDQYDVRTVTWLRNCRVNIMHPIHGMQTF